MPSPQIEELQTLFERRGPVHLGEAVSQLDHALQCADLAAAAGARPELVAAALLHDVGHLVQLERAGGRRLGADAELVHASVGARYLEPWFGPEVAVPVSLHVDAKRYLCATEVRYRTLLSDEARRRLDLQGGPMRRDELAEFVARPGAAEAVQIRRWDDAAKRDDVEATPLSEHLPMLEALLLVDR